MGIGTIIIIICLTSAVILLLIFVLKALIAPKKIDGIQKLIKQGRLPQAIKTAKALIQKNPNDYLARFYLGKAYLADSKHELALMEFKYVDEKAIFDENLSELDFRNSIAPLYLKFNQINEALNQYLLLTKLDPDNAENFYNVAKIYEERGKAEPALGFYEKTIRLDRRHVKAHAAMGLLLFRAKRFQDAKKEIDLAISLSPETFSTYYYLGKILKENRDYPGAVKAFEKAARDPDFRQKAFIECGTCYMAGQSIENAMNCFERAISSPKDAEKPETLYARYFLAQCYEKTRKIEKAIEQWELIYKKNQNFRDVTAKLSEYKELQANDSLKEYLTSSEEEFNRICQITCKNALAFEPKQTENKKGCCIVYATPAANGDWRNVRKQVFSCYFFRESNPIEDSTVRRALDEVKSKGLTKTYILSSSGFTRTAVLAAENRPAELMDKAQLERLLDKASK